MTCRLASIDSRTHALWCDCGAKFWTRDELRRHMCGPTLEELVEEVEAGWRSVDHSWWEWSLSRDRVELHREEWPVEKPPAGFTRTAESVMVG